MPAPGLRSAQPALRRLPPLLSRASAKPPEPPGPLAPPDGSPSRDGPWMRRLPLVDFADGADGDLRLAAAEQRPLSGQLLEGLQGAPSAGVAPAGAAVAGTAAGSVAAGQGREAPEDSAGVSGQAEGPPDAPVNELRRQPLQLTNIRRQEETLGDRSGTRLPAIDQEQPPPVREYSALIQVPPSQPAEPSPSATPHRPSPDEASAEEAPPLPDGFVPWWQSAVTDSFRAAAERDPTAVNDLVLDALIYSQQIRALREQPLIREMAIFEAQAEFDPQAFMESKFIRTSEPVGDELTTGGPPRFRESDWYYSAGLRRKGRRGGRFEVAQRIGYLDNNSLFLLPTQQGNGRLTLSFEQPLLRGAGEYYNSSLILLAELDAAIAQEQTSRDLQQYLLEVYRAYWDLYLQRASLLQMQRSVERAQEILTTLDERQDFDSTHSQIVVAQAAVATRRAALVRSSAAVQDAQARIGALVNAPGLSETQAVELIPISLPSLDYAPIPLDDAVVTALSHRPEIDEAVRQMDAARVRLDVSESELLPALSLVLETYVSGLEGESRVGRAWLNQFSKGEPSYTAGLVFEMPLCNRGAQARYERRQRELQQLVFRFNALVANLRAEVEVAVREVDTSFREVKSRFASMEAAQAEVASMRQRWELLPGDDRAASLLLEDLLAAQNRLSDEEAAFVDAQISYAIAQAELKRAMGVLMDYEVALPEFMPAAEVPPLVFE